MKRRIFWIIMFAAYLCAVAYLCFGRFDDLPQVRQAFLGIEIDKIVHFCMFFPFTILLYFSIRWDTKSILQSLMLIAFLVSLGVLAGRGTEYIQGLIGYRNQDLRDFRADMLSVCISSVIVLAIELYKFIRKRK